MITMTLNELTAHLVNDPALAPYFKRLLRPDLTKYFATGYPSFYYIPARKVVVDKMLLETMQMNDVSVSEQLQRSLEQFRLRDDEALLATCGSSNGSFDLSIVRMDENTSYWQRKAEVKSFFRTTDVQEFITSKQHVPVQQDHAWDRLRTIDTIRGDVWGDRAVIEPGIAPMIHLFEAANCKTTFSCEGHPYGSYVVALAPDAIAETLRSEMHVATTWSHNDCNKIIIRGPTVAEPHDRTQRRRVDITMNDRDGALRAMYTEVHAALQPYLVRDPEALGGDKTAHPNLRYILPTR